ncbi:MAG: hypothetical protein COA58_16680 [Bacteroidetes bacterium]|nr:MAG: hypothetical protein COA58_16680 [Bacteroidota bacterium]
MQRTSLYTTFIQFVNTYSIWVALGSFTSYLFFSRIYDVEPNYLIATGLSLGVWFIYTLDHLLDGIKLKDKASTLRHKEHFEKQGVIKWLLITVAFTLIVIAFWVPVFYYRFIGMLISLTCIHFVINYWVSSKVKRLLFLKEVFIALIVTIGFSISPCLEIKSLVIISDFYPIFGLFFFINLANLMLFSFFDKEADRSTGTLSIAGFYSDTSLRLFIGLSLAISAFLTSYLFFGDNMQFLVFILLTSMQVTLLVINVFPAFFKVKDHYRFWGDFIYVYPLFVLPFL